MKKLSFLIFAYVIGLSFQSCQSDGGCNLEGKWKVKSTDVQSSKLSPSIIELTKEEIVNAEYEFTADGRVTFTNKPGNPPAEGTWTLDEPGKKLVLTFKDKQPETFNLSSCSSKEMTANQRAPEDPAAEALITINTVFEKVQ